MTHVEITGSGTRTSIKLDGHEVNTSVRALVLEYSLYRPEPLLRLDMSPRLAPFQGRATVVIDDASARILQAAGWTPPAQED